MEALTKQNLARPQKKCSGNLEDITLPTEGKLVSSARIQFPHPEADAKSLMLRGGDRIGILMPSVLKSGILQIRGVITTCARVPQPPVWQVWWRHACSGRMRLAKVDVLGRLAGGE